jgi:double-stranded uracil-DNA glycosylase
MAVSAMNERARSFPPIAAPDARVLVLGSMPGLASLAAGRYYAHPRNAFWPIIGRIIGIPEDADYATRVEALRDAGIALWDVLQSCRRRGSLDSAIEADSIVANDLSGFLLQHAHVSRICFNGATAESCFRRHVSLAALPGPSPEIMRLPSTSPAHAGMDFAAKLAAWQAALGPVGKNARE